MKVGLRVIIQAGYGGKGGRAGQDFTRFPVDTPAVVTDLSKNPADQVWVQPDTNPHKWRVPIKALKLETTPGKTGKLAGEVSTTKAVKLVETMTEKLKALYLDAKVITQSNNARPVRDAVESIYQAMALFGEASKVLVKQLGQEDAEEKAADDAMAKKKTSGLMASLKLAEGEGEEIPDGGKRHLLDSIRPGSRVTILSPGGMGRNGREYTERTGRAVMKGPAGWVLNMGGKHGTPGIASEKNIVRVKASFGGLNAQALKADSRLNERGAGTMGEERKTIESRGGSFAYKDSDVVNPDDFIPKGEFNPHNVRPWAVFNEYGLLAIVYASHEQDALDEAMDADKLNSILITDPEDLEEAEGFGEVSYLGNAGEPCDLNNIGLTELPNAQYGKPTQYEEADHEDA